MTALRSVTASLVSLAAAGLTALGTATPSTAGTSVSSDGWTKVASTPISSLTEVPNTARGQYRWMGYEPQPATWPANDVYYRDQVYWGRIERSDGQFDFSQIDRGIADAKARGGRFSFRVMAYCPGCWMESRPDKASWPQVTPSFIPTDGDGAPRWNDPVFLAQWRELMTELGRRYGSNPYIGSVDVGGYGKYGEWWVDRGKERITDANGLAVIKAVTTAFPRTWVLLNTMTPVDFTLAALKANPRLGLRTDSLGAPNMHSMLAVDTRLQGYWRTRPFFSEWATTGDPVLGRDQVRQYHVSTTSSQSMRLQYAAMSDTQKIAYRQAVRSAGYRYRVTSVSFEPRFGDGAWRGIRTVMSNQGSAGTYEAWRVELRLTRRASGTVYRIPLTADPRKNDAGFTTFTQRTGRTLPTGTYDVDVRITDPRGAVGPMRLAQKGRRSDGAYQMGYYTVRR